MIDLIGLAIVAALLIWIATRRGDGAAVARSVLVLASAASTYILARIASAKLNGWIVPTVVLLQGVGMALVSGGGLLENRLSPLGYSNATAAFYVMAAGAAVLVVMRCPLPPFRLLAGSIGLAFALVPLLNGSDAGLLSSLVMLTALAAQKRGWSPRSTVLASLVLALTVIGTSIAIAATSGHTSVSRTLGSVEAARVLYWQEAWTFAQQEPLRGIGIGEFEQLSESATAPGVRNLAHNSFLQAAAEAGWPAFALLVALVSWAFARLLYHPDLGSAVAAASLAATTSHAVVDYVWHYPLVIMAAAAVAGAGATPPQEAVLRSREDGDGSAQTAARV